MRARALAAFVLCLMSGPVFSEIYQSPSNRFAVEVGSPWERITVPDPTAELFLRCAVADACGTGSTLSFGAFFETALKAGTVDDFLGQANSTVITHALRSSPLVERVEILKEGRTRVGNSAAYEVLSRVLLRDGRMRMRHTFMTFRAGYVYNVSIGSAPHHYERAFQAAQPVLKSFRALAQQE